MIQQATISSGKLAAFSADGGRCVAFKGIPFAAPPVGALRWWPPQPVVPWQGTLLADRYASAPLQPLHGADHLLAQLGFADVPECGISENCLSLNVWTPAATPADRLPVIVWVYGGGFRVGSGSHPVSEGEGFARQGCVLVTINHRLSGLGFLAHPTLRAEAGGSGNYGLHDVLAALRWVQQNIAAFGGDPGCVTLFGQSAGAVVVNLLMASAATRGLVHRCIVHSGGRMQGGPMGALKSRADAEAEGVQAMGKLGAGDLAAMRAQPGDLFYGAPRQYVPILDGALVAEMPQQRFAQGAQLQVPLLCGFTTDESATFPSPEWQTRSAIESYIRQNFGESADDLLRLYEVRDDAAAIDASFRLRTDISFAYQPWQLAHSHAASCESPTWLFQFARALPLPVTAHFHGEPARGWCAFHGSELWYAFNTLDRKPQWPWTDADRALADAMCAYWANFARSGNPNGHGLPEWPRFAATRPHAMRLGAGTGVVASCSAGPVSNQAALSLIQRQYNAGSIPP